MLLHPGFHQCRGAVGNPLPITTANTRQSTHSIRKQDPSRRRHTRDRYLQIFLIQVYGVTKPLSTQQAELSRACPETQGRVLKNKLCDAPYVRARLFPTPTEIGTPCKDLGDEYVTVYRDNGVGYL